MRTTLFFLLLFLLRILWWCVLNSCTDISSTSLNFHPLAPPSALNQLLVMNPPPTHNIQPSAVHPSRLQLVVPHPLRNRPFMPPPCIRPSLRLLTPLIAPPRVARLPRPERIIRRINRWPNLSRQLNRPWQKPLRTISSTGKAADQSLCFPFRFSPALFIRSSVVLDSSS